MAEYIGVSVGPMGPVPITGLGKVSMVVDYYLGVSSFVCGRGQVRYEMRQNWSAGHVMELFGRKHVSLKHGRKWFIRRFSTGDAIPVVSAASSSILPVVLVVFTSCRFVFPVIHAVFTAISAILLVFAVVFNALSVLFTVLLRVLRSFLRHTLIPPQRREPSPVHGCPKGGKVFRRGGQSAAGAAPRFVDRGLGRQPGNHGRRRLGLLPAHAELCAGKPCHCLLYTSPSPRDKRQSRMPSSA